VIVAAALVATPASAQYAALASGAPRKECLDEKAKATIKQLKSLTRSLTNDDPELPFDPDYFVGSWDVEWDVPESPFGQAGTVTGTMTIRHVEGCSYEGELTGKDAEGSFSSKIQLVYDPAVKYLVWIETHSRGYTFVRPGRVGGDLGGAFTHFWEAPVMKINGSNVRLIGYTSITSPLFYRLRAQISTDGEPYVNFGNPWFRKQTGPVVAAPR
jgi:hypothetical protein